MMLRTCKGAGDGPPWLRADPQQNIVSKARASLLHGYRSM